MSEWITDRLPTAADSVDGLVLVLDACNNLRAWSYYMVRERMPWHPIVPPDPYVKPKRWTVTKYQHEGAEYGAVFLDGQLIHRVAVSLTYEAAQRIADLYNEVMP
jgi:hypothetical protein